MDADEKVARSTDAVSRREKSKRTARRSLAYVPPEQPLASVRTHAEFKQLTDVLVTCCRQYVNEQAQLSAVGDEQVEHKRKSEDKPLRASQLRVLKKQLTKFGQSVSATARKHVSIQEAANPNGRREAKSKPVDPEREQQLQAQLTELADVRQTVPLFVQQVMDEVFSLRVAPPASPVKSSVEAERAVDLPSKSELARLARVQVEIDQEIAKLSERLPKQLTACRTTREFVEGMQHSRPSVLEKLMSQPDQAIALTSVDGGAGQSVNVPLEFGRAPRSAASRLAARLQSHPYV